MVQVKQQVIYRKKNTGVGFLLLDCPGRVNLLTTPVLHELRSAVEQIRKDDGVTAVVALSGKPDTFMSGADLHEIIKFKNEEAAYNLAKQGQEVLKALSGLGKPVVVGINGSCLGGGLELALWCHRRIATTSESTVLGLPEVRLGLIPGLGGTQMLPRLIGVKAALDVVLSSEPVSAQAAYELGIIDKLVHPDDMLSETERAALELVASGDWQRPDRQPDPKDEKLFAMAERSVRIRTKGHYPAHTRVLQVMRDGLARGLDAGLELEARTFGELALTDTSRNLIFLFFSTAMTSHTAASQANKMKAGTVATVGVIGGGVMGNGVAQVAAATGHQVLHKQTSREQGQEAPAPETPGIERVASLESFAGADLILEAISEEIDLKARLFNDLCPIVPPDCVLASNTSSLSIAGLASMVPGSERLLGLHFFHPVDKMQLVEVISHPGTSQQSLYRALSFVVKLGKTPVAVKDGPGFLVNRLLCCYLLEAARLAGEGVPLNWLEEAAVGFGMPMGPMALLDEVGLDIGLKVADQLHGSFGVRFAPPAVLEQTRPLGMLGKKTGEGLYQYDDRGRRLALNPRLIEALRLVTSDKKADEQKSAWICDRMLLPMLDEAARCLEDKIVRRARELDMAMVLGIGFPPFRGGPLRYADSIGIPELRARLERVYAEVGSGRSVSELLLKMESSARRFYSMSREAEDS